MRYDYTDLAKSHLPGMQTAFMGGYKGAPAKRNLIATQIPSTQKIETYPWLADVKGPEEWTTERVPTGGIENYLSVTNKDYAITWEVDRDALRYEKYGQLKMQAGARGRVLSEYIDELILTLLTAAETTATYTGDGDTYIADAAHTEGSSGTQSNLGSSALDNDSLTAARLAMLKFKDARGKPLGIVGDTLVVPPDLEATALTLVGSERIVGNANNDMNIHRGAYRVVVNQFWTDADAWALLCTTGHIKPFIWQEFQGPTPVDIVLDELKTKKRVWYGSDMTGRAAFTDWRYIYFVTP